MTVLTIPPGVAAECAKTLFSLAATANRDAMTLIKQAMALARNEQVARPLGVLIKYVREHNQYGSGEVSEVITSIQEAADPEHVKRLVRNRIENDRRRAEIEEREKETLRRASALMCEQEASRDLIEAVLAFHERRGSLWDVDKYLPGGHLQQAAQLGAQLRAEKRELEEALKHQGGNVVAGPWDTAG